MLLLWCTTGWNVTRHTCSIILYIMSTKADSNSDNSSAIH